MEPGLELGKWVFFSWPPLHLDSLWGRGCNFLITPSGARPVGNLMRNRRRGLISKLLINLRGSWGMGLWLWLWAVAVALAMAVAVAVAVTVAVVVAVASEGQQVRSATC